MTKRDMKVAVTSGQLLPVMLCLLFPLCAAGEATIVDVPAGVDISDWVCQYCVFERGFSGDVEVGIGSVSDDSFKFGEYNGLYDDGPFLIGNATARYRDGNAGHLDLRVRELGLDTRSVEIEGGRQGKYQLFLQYDGKPHYISDSAMTSYLGSGSDTLQLPPGWVTAGSTGGMTALAASLRDIDLKAERKRTGVGIAFIPASKWRTAVNFRHEVRNGQKKTAGSFFFNSAQLVEPVDYVTDEVEASVTYTTRKWQAKLAYFGSFFRNQNESLTWQNAYNPIVGGADTGQRALPPDNQFHQILLSSGYQWSERTRVSGDIAIGRMEQDEALLAATINPTLGVALPRTSANAQVNTLTGNLKVDSTVSNKLRLNVSYRYNDRDNRTPSEVLDWVTTDAFVALPRRNLPYSFTDNTMSLGAAYRLDKATRLRGGYEYAKKERTHQEVDETQESTFWAKVGVHVREDIDMSLKAAHAERDASGYHLVTETDPSQNPLLRKYNLADRSRDTVSFHAGLSPNERMSIGLGLDFSNDDYSDSALGLSESQEVGFNADASVILSDVTSLHAFGGRQRIKSEQAGSQTFSTPGWLAKDDDTIDSFGIGVQHQLMQHKLVVGADYVLSRSTGRIRVETGAPGADFPVLKADLDTLKLYADYRLKDKLTLHVAYWYESYDSKDWMLDGVDPDTVSGVLGLGEDTPRYDVHAVMISTRYRF